MKRKSVKILLCIVIVALVGALFTATAFATGDVAGAIENTWTSAQGQVKDVVNKVVFPVWRAPKRNTLSSCASVT